MSVRDFTKLISFDFFGEKLDRKVKEPRPILDVTYSGDEDEIRDYLPSRNETSMIVQLLNDDGKSIFQELTGKWDKQMILLAEDLKLIHENTGRERIIDSNVTSIHNFFGTDGEWQIKSWEVVAKKHPADPLKGRLIDTIVWHKVIKGKFIKSTSSSHEWRIY